MRIHVLSDLHLEFQGFDPLPTDADLVVLAGDIAVGDAGLRWAQRTFHTPVVYVAGNHEYYGRQVSQQTIRQALARLARGTHAHFLDDQVFTLGNVRVLGATLWTDFAVMGDAALGMHAAGALMSDFHGQIRHAGSRLDEPFSPAHSLALHRASRAFLERELARSWPGPTVVATHHAPSALSIAPRYATHPANGGFASDLEALVRQATLWIHGHTHTSFDYRVGGCRVVCNPRGYPLEDGDENPAFDARYVVEV
jgi:predicted phosphodiesterase